MPHYTERTGTGATADACRTPPDVNGGPPARFRCTARLRLPRTRLGLGLGQGRSTMKKLLNRARNHR
jgi:hypothetical protein